MEFTGEINDTDISDAITDGIDSYDFHSVVNDNIDYDTLGEIIARDLDISADLEDALDNRDFADRRDVREAVQECYDDLGERLAKIEKALAAFANSIKPDPPITTDPAIYPYNDIPF